MLSAARRGPASVARLLPRSPTAVRIPDCIFNQKTLSRNSQFRPLLTLRTFSSATSNRRSSAAPAQVVEEVEVEEELNAQRPPIDEEIHESTQHGPVTRFAELLERGMVSKPVVNTLTQDMGLETMTQVQSLTINESLKGIDVLAQARTGTGKTLAFLIPILQNIINVDPSLEQPRSRSRRQPIDIRALIISPTRELAEQIAVEAKKLTKHTSVIVQTAVGGSAKRANLRMMQAEGCHILVGTPGRLNDVLSDPYSGVRAPNLSAFVLDEADRLLDQGFAPEIKNIQDLLPNRQQTDRQTLLYSATVPNEVMDIVRRTMKRDFKFVRTVQAGEQQTHEKIPQKYVVVRGFANMLPALLELCNRELARKDRKMPFKAIVYYSATAEVELASKTFESLKTPGQSVFHRHPLHPASTIEIHARLSQHQRTRAAEKFRRAESAILFSSDVTARGMDFPNVSHVIQVGLPQSKDTYIHRIGRTGRGDKLGEGWLIINDFEAGEMGHRLDRLPIKPDHSLETAMVDMSQDAQLPEHVAKTLTQVIDASRTVPMQLKAAAYLANLGVYQWLRHKQDLVDSLNDRSRYCWALETPPRVAPGLQQKMGLSRIRGLSIASSFADHGDRSSAPDRGSSFGSSRPQSSGYSRGGSTYDRGRGGFDGGSSDDGTRGGFGRARSQGGFERRDNRSFDRGDRGGGFDRARSQGGFERTSNRSYDRGDRDRDADGSFQGRPPNRGYGSGRTNPRGGGR